VTVQEVRFVLVRPGGGGNIGAAARALKNMGYADLRLVAPRAYDAAEARRLAHNAVDVLEAAHTVDSLATALADCRWVVGTTRRAGRRRRATLSPRQFATRVLAEPERGPTAVVFGPEEDGLSMAELALCNDVVRIPTAGAHPSLNLAQAVLVVAYELHLLQPAWAPDSSGPGPEAPSAALEQMYEHFEAALLAIGFVRPDTAPHRILALRRILGRARLRPGDVRLLRGICRQILWAAGRQARPGGAAPETPRAVRRSRATPRPAGSPAPAARSRKSSGPARSRKPARPARSSGRGEAAAPRPGRLTARTPAPNLDSR
jgi:TrmH family RNA methyltransferase